MSSSDRFGYEWNKYSYLHPNYEKQFRNWTYPLTPDDFRGKAVLDAGCGMGRNSVWPLQWGAKKVVAFDCDNKSLDAAKKNLSSYPQAQVVFSSIYDIAWKNEFDIAFSIGVIHHLKDPKKGIQNMVAALKPGGKLLLWVYSYEGNEWIVKYVNPVRKNITSRLPLGLVHFLAYFASAPLWAFVKIFRGPSGYLKQLSGFRFWHIHSIVFDQLIPDVANYWTRDEARNLLDGSGLSQIQVYAPPNDSGWICTGVKK